MGTNDATATAPADMSAGLQALLDHVVTAEVKDLDHYRTHGGVSVETDYIVEVKGSTYFEPFYISKTYSQFRTLTSELKDICETFASYKPTFSEADRHLAKVANVCGHLIESQPTEYLGKVSYIYVKGLAKQRQTVVDDILRQLLEHFPTSFQGNELCRLIGNCMEVFFLTDHCEANSSKHTTISKSHSDRQLAEPQATSSSSTSSSSAVDRLNPLHWNLDKKSIGKGLGKGLSKVGSGLGSGISTVTSGVGTGITTVTSGVGTVVKKIDITGVFCATDDDNKTLTSPVRSRKEGAGAVTDKKLVPMTTKSRHAPDASALEGTAGTTTVMMEETMPEEVMAATASPKATPKKRAAVKPKSTLQLVTEHGHLAALGVVVLAVYFKVRERIVFFTLDGDVVLVALAVAYYLGKKYSSTATAPQVSDRHVDKGRAMMKRTSMYGSPSRQSVLMSPLKEELMRLQEEEEEEEFGEILDSPLPMFPQGAKIGSHNNCWSVPDHSSFLVRGPKYLEDRKKVASKSFLFPTRGIDLFLTDACPEHVGSFSCVFGGNLRTVPTFLINFRLPWGVLIFYFEIPTKFLPFVRAAYEPDFDKTLLPSLDDMTPGERTACRFLLGDVHHKNQTLKIVPVVVDGPWIVKNVVGGKPALIGTKLPVKYIYQAADGDKALYLEADLDIAASSAARGILSVTRSYTEILTIDLGFVVQGNAVDELSEQMLVGCRIHGVDPLTAQQLPLQSTSLFMAQDATESSELTYE